MEMLRDGDGDEGGGGEGMFSYAPRVHILRCSLRYTRYQSPAKDNAVQGTTTIRTAVHHRTLRCNYESFL